MREQNKKEKRFVRYAEGAEMYSMGYKLNHMVLVNLDVLDEYLETFRITDEDFYK